MTIEEFIEARLAEDSAIAVAARVAVGRQWDHDDHFVNSDGEPFATSATSESLSAVWRHIARNDPARTGAQVAVLRAVLELIAGMASMSQQIEAEAAVLYRLAAIWDKHPDYRDEWAATP